jgi:hypothetical protein
MRTVAMSGPVAAELFWIFESDIRRLVGAAKYSAGGSTPRTDYTRGSRGIEQNSRPFWILTLGTGSAGALARIAPQVRNLSHDTSAQVGLASRSVAGEDARVPSYADRVLKVQHYLASRQSSSLKIEVALSW